MEQSNNLIQRIRQLAVCGFLLLLMQGAMAQNITRIEYFYDTDPGFGLGTSVSILTPAANIPSLSFTASITALSPGFHTLYVRSRDANNKWSLTTRHSFVKYSGPTGLASSANINKMEYFIDTDPGFGLGTNVPVTTSADISNMSFNVPIAAVSGGLHTLYVRTRDINGKWSLTTRYTFVKYTAPTGIAGAANVNKVEYFIDTDPGFGLAANVPVTPGMDISGLAFNVPISALSAGFHTLYVRSRDADNKWSLTTRSSFVKYTAPAGIAGATNVNKMEYFVDSDPGFGLATNVPVTAAMDIPGMVFTVPINALSNGFHTVYVRTRDVSGKWSLTTRGSFVKYAAPTGLAAAGNLIKMEYFIDTDPGFGNGANIQFTHGTNVSNLVANVDLTSVANGFHTVYIRSMDTLRRWSLTARASFSGGQLQAPTASITVNGPSTFCLGSGTYLSANYSASATYQWKLGGNNINGATSITYVPTQSGNYTVVVTNAISGATSSPVSITVNPVPTATLSANGPLTFCQGGSVTLSVNSTANATYQWLNYGNNINGSTGTTYVANASGVYSVRVTSTNGCSTISVNDTVVVNPSPGAAITPSGSTSFCQGDSVVLFANTGSGLTYAWSNNTSASFIKVFAQGTYTVTVTGSGSCSATASVSVTVAPAPTATITPGGPTTFCNGNSVTLSANTGSGLSYSWTGGATTSSISVTTSGTYTVTVSNTGCSRVSSPVTVTVNPGPAVGVSGTTNTVCQGNTSTLTANGATTYAWSGAGLNTNAGAVVIATPTATTTYTVTGTTSGCVGTATYTVSVSPINTQVSTTTPNICGGGSAVLNASGATTYAWSPAGTLSAATGATVTATPGSTTTYTVTGTTGSCTSTATVTVNVNATVIPSVSISTPQNSVCAGTQVTFTAAPVNGGASPTYQWYRNGVLQSGNAATFSSTTLANNDSVWVVMTSNAPCPTPATATSNKVYMAVTPITVPTISIAASQNPVCAGTGVTFTATISNGGVSPIYQWYKNNATVGPNAATYTLSAPANNDSVWCVLLSNATCATPTTVTSAKVKMVVTPITAPTVTASASQNPICAGATITFSAVGTGGGSSPIYQWYKNGNTVGTNSDTYIDNTLANNDSVWVSMLSNAACVSPTIATSSKVVIVIAPQVVPSVTVTTPQTSVCVGATVSFTANPTNGGNAPTYQWYKNGVLQPGNTSAFSAILANNDSVWAVMTSNATCPVPTTATSNKVKITVNQPVTPTISIAATSANLCEGDSITFTATVTNGGANPTYQWKKNNINVGSNSATYGSTTLANNDSVWCVFTSNAPCPVPATVTSNKIKLVVNPVTSPSITVIASQSQICPGTTVTFTATATNGGSSPVYTWRKNGVIVGTNSATYTDNALADNDSVWCLVVSNKICAQPNNAISNKVIMVVTTVVVPAVSITVTQSTICAGSNATFTATPVNGGNGATYQWYKNGVLQSGNTASFSSTSVANNDSVWVIMTSNANCASPLTATSNKVYMTVNPISVPTVSVTASQNPSCAGDAVTYTATITNGGASPIYQWFTNNATVGNNAATYTLSAPANNDSVWVVLLSNATCATPATLASAKVHQVVNPIVSPTVLVTASANPACDGSTVTFTTTITNGGSAPTFQWFKNGAGVGTSLSSYSDNTLADNDSVWTVLTSNASCLATNTATSSNVVMSITPTVSPSVVISASNTTVCAGNAVDFTATPTNGGASPVYQWYKNGVLQSGNTGSFSATSLADNDSVYVVVQSNAVCPLPATATSNAIPVTVLPVAHYAFSQSICHDASYTFGGTDLGASGTYYDTLQAANGCDSIITLSLTVNPAIVTQLSQTVCNGEVYNFNGRILTGSGVYNDTLQSVAGCDSLIVLSLQLLPVYTDSSTAAICQGDVYSFYGQNLTASGVYRDTLLTANGCDSIQVLNLTVHPLPVAAPTLSGNDTLRVFGFSKYQWLLNNNVLTADTNPTLIAITNGSYSVLVTDSSGCSDTSSTVSVTGVGITEATSLNLVVYPNPTEGKVMIQADNAGDNTTLELRDDLGRLLYTQQLSGTTIRAELDLTNYASGVYLLSVKGNGKALVVKRIFKN